MRGVLARLVEAAWSREVARHYRDAIALESCGREAVEAFQLAKLNRLVDHFRSFPFYAKLLTGAGDKDKPLDCLGDMSRLPTISKDDITANFAAIASSPYARRRESTSGSTGKNFVFYQSRSRQPAQRASLRRGREWAGVDHFNDRTVLIWGLSPQTSKWAGRRQDLIRLLMGTTLLQGYGLDAERCIAHWHSINRIRPQLIEGYPNYLLTMAKEGARAGIVPHRATSLICSGETLFEEAREEIEDFFHAPLHNRYGSREFSSIAHQCRERGAMHIHPERFIMESDSDGELLITDLDNLATPFIRYRVGDAGRVEFADCACGRSLFNIVEMVGRTHDVIRTPSGTPLPGQFWTTLSRAVEGIEEFQLVQRSPTDLELRVKVTDVYEDGSEAYLRKKVQSVAGAEVTLTVVKVDTIEPTPAGKRRFIINEMEGRNAGR